MMDKGDRIQWACGHWLVAGTFGIQDDSIRDVPRRRCGPCRDRLRDAAPQLLEALEHSESGLRRLLSLNVWNEQADNPTYNRASLQALDNANEARAAIQAARKEVNNG